MNRSSPIYQRPEDILRALVRYDTTNPPGNEKACIDYIDGLLHAAGFETTLVGAFPHRPNLVARLAGRGEAPGLMLYGHVDVVTTEGQTWTYPPFGGDLVDGYIWGRGTLDMKGGVAMMLAAFLRAKAEGLTPAGDIVFAALADEENAATYGARLLVEEHADLFRGMRYAIGELGGFPLRLAGKKLYGIQLAEKQVCRWDATVRGPAGHASMPIRGGAMAKLARMLRLLDEQRLPVHITPVARMFFQALAEALGGDDNVGHRLLDPARTDATLDALGEEGLMFNAMLHNTVSPTVVHGGHQANVIPSAITVHLDGRVLPGYDQDDMRRELQALLGDDVDLELTRFHSGPSEPDMGFYDTLADILREADPTGIPVPLLLTATTDARLFSQLGIQTYGYLPMDLPPELNVLRMAHNADERVPVGDIKFGTEAIYQAIVRLGS